LGHRKSTNIRYLHYYSLKVNINAQFIANSLLNLMERFRTITAIQKALSLNVFVTLIYRTGIVISAFYYLNINNVENQNEDLMVCNNI
jgi:hypothetical protein